MKIKRILPVILYVLFSSLLLKAQNTPSSPGIFPDERRVTLSWDVLNAAFDAAPAEFTAGSVKPVLDIPAPDGGILQVEVERSTIMEEGIAQLYPEIKCYRLLGANGDNTVFGKIITNRYGIDGMISTLSGSIKITPVGDAQRSEHRIYWYRENPNITQPACGNVDVDEPEYGPQERSIYANGSQLKVYRYAFTNRAQPDDFSNIINNNPPYSWASAADFNTAVLVDINNMNTYYERDFNIRLVLPNNNQLLYSPDTIGDYAFRSPANNTNSGWSAPLDSAHAYITRILGSANFDVGNVVFTYSPVGLGGGQVCNNANKGRCLNVYSSLGTYLHEIGHMNTCPHTFNSITQPTCATNIHSYSAYETGSGTSVMSYYGSCNVDDITPRGDPNRFHSSSFRRFQIHNTSVSCATVTNTGNLPPVVSVPAGGNYLPKSTPFYLTGSATDANGNTILYSWEQMDLGPNGPPNSPTGNAPLFRIFNPVTTPTRIFPQLSDILNGTQTMGEILPFYTRDMRFVLLATDNVGGSDMEEVLLHVDGNSGPFKVTSQSTYAQFAGGSSIPVTWTVGGTTGSLINCQNVKISLSTDGGQSWGYVLAASTPNDGSHTVTLPSVSAGNCRIKVEAVNNIFFNINAASFVITTNTTAGNLALHADGTDDYVDLGTSWGNFGSGDFTIEFMIKTTATSGAIISKRTYCSYDSFWVIFVSFGRVRVELCTDNTGTNYVNFIGNVSINDGNWHHVAVTRSGSTAKIYVDGVQDVQNTSSGASISNSSPVLIGKQVCSGTNLNATLDELRIWNVARTQAQLSGNMLCGFGPGTSAQIAYYNFNNPAATAGGTNTGITLLSNTMGTTGNGTLSNFALSGASSNWVSGNSSVGVLWYQDNDNDGHGNAAVSTCAVAQPTGYVTSYDDCNDNNSAVFYSQAFFADTDNDGYGSSVSALFCQSATPAGYATNSLDCNDACASCHPNGTEACNGVDDNCSGIIDDLDADNDGYYACDYDCDDSDANVNPYGVEVCSNSKDDDCDGYTDTEINKCLSFDGVDDYVEVTQFYAHQQTFTIEAWIKTISVNKQVMNWDVPHQAQVFVSSSGWLGYGESDGTWAGWHGGPAINDNQWHHIAIVRTPTTVTAYTDGNQVFSVSNSKVLSTNKFTIGAFPDGTSGLSGSLDEIRIWSAALTQTQLQQRMSRKLDGNEANLVRYYNFQHGKPGLANPVIKTLKDITANGGHGALKNFALTGSASNWTASWTYPTLYLDNDNDGYGGSTAWTCGSMTNLVTSNLDCNDNNASINPYALEVCGNTSDDDCDNLTDTEVNKALHFDGTNDRVSLINIFTHQPPFTLEAWIKTSTSSRQIMNWQGASGHTAELFVSSAGLAAYGENNGAFIAWHGGPSIVDNQWHHVAAVRTATTVTVYVDGNVAWSNAISYTLSTNAFNIGGFNNGSQCFNGTIDEVRVWNTALTQTQIQQRKDRRLDGNETNLVRYFSFDHGKPAQTNTGLTLLKDRTSNNGNGTLYNFALTGATSNWITSWTYPALYADSDNDGYGGTTAWTCGTMTGLVTSNLDCDDNSAAINPYAVEICGNGIDDDCDNLTDSEVNKALSFDGTNDRVNLTNIFTHQPPFTLEAWVKTSTISRQIMNWQGAGGHTAELFVSSAGLAAYGENNGAFIAWHGGASIIDNQWHHVAAVRTATNVTVYVDGNVAWSSAISYTLSTNAFTIGAFSNGSSAFNGTIDEVRIWNTSLTQTLIQQRMNTRLNGNETNLVRYFTFDHGKPGLTNTGLTLLKDRTSNNGNGTLNTFALTGATSNWVNSWNYLLPEINITGLGQGITDGDITPVPTDDTDFGGSNIGTAVSHTFTIQNTGTGSLGLTGSPRVQITGNTMFTVTTQPAATIAASGSTTFVIQFLPTAAGLQQADVKIDNDDCSENPYNFKIQGTGQSTVNTWLGTTAAWATGSNWSNGSAPSTCSDDAIIAATGNNPVISSAATVGNITLNTGAGITLNSTLNVCGNFTANTNTLSGAGTLNFQGTGNQTLTGTVSVSGIVNVTTGATLVTTSGSLVFENGAYLMHGTGTTGAGGAVTGPITLKRQGTTSPSKYNYWSTPTAGGILPGSSGYLYNAASGTNGSGDDTADPGWSSFSGSMATAKGYASRAGGLASLTGTPNNANLSVGVTTSAQPLNSLAAPSLFNLIGNPYPSPISISSFLSANAPGTIAGVVYFWDDDNSGGTGYSSADYAVSTGIGGTAGGGGNTPNNYIAAAQGFMVEANTNSNVNFTNSMRGGNNNQFFKTEEETQKIWLNLYNETLFNEILIAFKDDATEQRDILYDAYKRRGSSQIAFAALQGEDEFVIVAFPSLTEERIIPLSVFVAQQGNYTIKNKAAENLDNIYIYLEDRLTGTFTDISNEGEYSTFITSGENTDRFFLHFSSTITSVNENTAPEIRTWISADKLYVIFSGINEEKGDLGLYDLTGKLIYSRSNMQTAVGFTTIETSGIAAGMYVVSFHTNARSYTSKIVIR